MYSTVISSSDVTANDFAYGTIIGLVGETITGSGIHLGASKFYSTITIPTGKGLGKVLTSDADGNATWQAAVAVTSHDVFTVGRSSSVAVAANTGIGITMVGDGTVNAPRGFVPITLHSDSATQTVLGSFVTTTTGNPISIQLRTAPSIPAFGLTPQGGTLLAETTFTPTDSSVGNQFTINSTTPVTAGSLVWINVVDTISAFAGAVLGATIKA